MSVKEPASFFEEVRARLVRLVHARPFRFTETRRSEAERYLRSASRFAGYSDGEIQSVERWAEGRLPAVYREFLAQMGIASGELFCDCKLPVPGESRALLARAQRILAASGARAELPEKSVVVYLREGCVFTTLRALGADDGPVQLFSVDEGKFVEAASSFGQLVLDRLEALEEGHRRSTAAGGYFVTINEKYGVRHTHPARDSGIRALDRADEFVD